MIFKGFEAVRSKRQRKTSTSMMYSPFT